MTGAENENALDANFWERMNSRDSAFDTPGMSTAERIPPIGFEVLVTTSAGKPVVYHAERVSLRPFQSIISLCAACTAFDASTSGQVRTVTTASGCLFFGRFADFRVVVAGHNEAPPLELLRSIGTIAVSSIYFFLSSGFATALKRNPALDVGVWADRVSEHVAQALRRSLGFPLVPALMCMPSIPGIFSKDSLRQFTDLLTSCQRRHRTVTHVIALTAAPPYPHRILCCVSPVHSKLTNCDILFLSSLLPLDASTPQLPERVYLQCDSYSRPSVPFCKRLELRLNGSDVEAFKKGVGGETWRPQWSAECADVIWLIVLCESTTEDVGSIRSLANDALEFLERNLDRSSLAKDVLICIERPLRVEDIGCSNDFLKTVKAVVWLNDGCIVASICGLEYMYAPAILRLQRERNDSIKETEVEVLCSMLCESIDAWVVATDGAFVFCSTQMSRDASVYMCLNDVFPWLRQRRAKFFLPNFHASIPPRTPLAFFLTPFES